MPRRSLSGWRASAALGLAMIAVALVLSTCGRAADDAARGKAEAGAPAAHEEDIAQRLPGTWLREHEEQGVRSRRLLRLEPDGSFSEAVRIVQADGAVTDLAHAGTWLYDGTNLKRKYTLMNGQPPSRLNLPFATFAIRFESRNEFIGVDHIHQNTVRYRRVATESQL